MSLVAAVLLLAAGCGAIPSGPVAAVPVPDPQADWPTARATIGDRAITLILAADHNVGMRGLTGLPDPIQGMLFWYGSPVDPRLVAFTMRGVPIDLDIHFFDATGGLVESVRMSSCSADPCPSYGAHRPFVFAVEAPAGSLTIASGDRMELLDPVGGLSSRPAIGVDPATAGPSSESLTTTAAGA